MEKMKLGSLAVDRRIWVRKRLSLDHIECLVRDLVNGDNLPPLKVEKQTNIIIGGNHRYEALKKYYGSDWKNIEVAVELIDLPPFEEDPTAWYQEALTDNQHLSQRLGYQDRNKAAANLIKTVSDPLSTEAVEMSRLLKHTPETWKTFCENYLGNTMPRPAVKDDPPATSGVGEARPEEKAEDDPPPLWEGTGSKTVTDSTTPTDVKPVSLNSSIMRHAASLERLLGDIEPDMLSKRSVEMLKSLASLISSITNSKAM